MSTIDEQCDELIRLGIINKAESNRIKANSMSQSSLTTSQVSSGVGNDSPKSRKVAAALGVLLGCVCANKLYLKQITPVYPVCITLVGLLICTIYFCILNYLPLVAFSYGTNAILSLVIPITSFFWAGVSILVAITAVLGITEGIIYLTMSDERFSQLYIEGNRKWF